MKFHTDVHQCLGISFQCRHIHIDVRLIIYSWYCSNADPIRRSPQVMSHKHEIFVGMENSNMTLFFKIDKYFINYPWKRTYDFKKGQKTLKIDTYTNFGSRTSSLVIPRKVTCCEKHVKHDGTDLKTSTVSKMRAKYSIIMFIFLTPFNAQDKWEKVVSVGKISKKEKTNWTLSLS